MKKILCLVLALFLCLSSAFAAPLRERTLDTQSVDESARTFATLVAGASLLRDQQSFEKGTLPSQALVEGMFLLGIKDVVFPIEQKNMGSLTHEIDNKVLAMYYDALFLDGTLNIQTPICPCIKKSDTGLVFDLMDIMEDMTVGAHIYDVKEDGDFITLFLDVYTVPAFFKGNAQTAPEEHLLWEKNMTVTLKKDASSFMAYKLVRFDSSMPYLDGAVSEWQWIRGNGFTLRLPSIFAEAGDNTYQTADAMSTFTIKVQDDMHSDKLEYLLGAAKKERAGGKVDMDAPLGMFTISYEDAFKTVFAREELDKVYILTMTFPKDRQAEFTLYSEIIRNTFAGEGLADG